MKRGHVTLTVYSVVYGSIVLCSVSYVLLGETGVKIASGRKKKRSLMEQSKLKTKSIWPMPKRKNLQPVSKRNTLV